MMKNAEYEEKKKAKMGLNKKGKEEEIKKLPKWKRQSEQFRNVLKNARKQDNEDGNFMVVKGGQGGGNVQKVVQQTPNYDYDDLKHCDLCNRRYNDDAFTKHLPTCQRKQKESLLKGNNNKGGSNTVNKPNLNVKFTKK